MDLNITDLDGDNLEYEIVGGVDRDFFLDNNFSESSVLAFASRNDDPDFPAFDNRKDLPKGLKITSTKWRLKSVMEIPLIRSALLYR